MRHARCVWGLTLLSLTGLPLCAQVPGGALEHTLQRVPVTKHYEDKQFGDHLFLEGGLGTNSILTDTRIRPGFRYEVSVGDWLTPEHGIRLTASNGFYNQLRGGRKINPKFTVGSISYLMNLTAIAHRKYDEPKPVEFYGVAGIDLGLVETEGEHKIGGGVHIGLRGQWNTSPYTYLYVEPRIELQGEKLNLGTTPKGTRTMASVSAGLGYRLNPAADHAREDQEAPEHPRNLLNNTFFSLGGGTQTVIDNYMPRSYRHWGSRAAVSAGKYITPIHGVRLTATYGKINLPDTYVKDSKGKTEGWLHGDLKSVSAHAEYMVNLHNLFGGIAYDRRWQVSGLLGLGIARTSGDGYRNTSLGASLGAHGLLHLYHGFGLFVEPRVDVYTKNYARYAESYRPVNTWGTRLTAVPSLTAGLSYTYNTLHFNYDTAPVEEFKSENWHDHVFVEAGIGVGVPVIGEAVKHANRYIRPNAYIGIGKWFTPLHGARVWGQGGQYESVDDEGMPYKHVEAGLDYLFDLTNATSGYRPDKVLHFILGAGVNVGTLQGTAHKLKAGANVFGRAQWRAGRMVKLFVEPRLQVYDTDYLYYDPDKQGANMTLTAMAGLQLDLGRYNRAASRSIAEEDGGLPRFISVSAGASFPGSVRTAGWDHAPSFRVGYTQWFTPLSAWRTNLSAYAVVRGTDHRYASGSASLDYMTDLTAHALGYDPDRLFSLYAFAGFGLGAEYCYTRLYFNPDLHAGVQAAFRVSDHVRLHVEPQLAYRFTKRLSPSRIYRTMPQVLFGLDYSFNRMDRGIRPERSDKPSYISVGVGAGIFSRTLVSVSPAGRKIAYAADLHYGRWINGLHGWQIGFSSLNAPNNKKLDMFHVSSIRLDYVLNVISLLTGERGADRLFYINGIMGASLNIAHGGGEDTRCAPGCQLALQGNFRLNDRCELFIQPEGSLMGKRVGSTPRYEGSNGNAHPFETDLRFMIGTKVNF